MRRPFPACGFISRRERPEKQASREGTARGAGNGEQRPRLGRSNVCFSVLISLNIKEAGSSRKCCVAQGPRFGVSSLLFRISNTSVNIKTSLLPFRKVEKGEEEGNGPFPAPSGDTGGKHTVGWRKETERKYRSTSTTVNMAPKDAPKKTKNKQKQTGSTGFWLLACVMNYYCIQYESFELLASAFVENIPDERKVESTGSRQAEPPPALSGWLVLVGSLQCLCPAVPRFSFVSTFPGGLRSR